MSRLLHAAVYIANLFFLTSDTDAPITTDKELTQEVAGDLISKKLFHDTLKINGWV